MEDFSALVTPASCYAQDTHSFVPYACSKKKNSILKYKIHLTQTFGFTPYNNSQTKRNVFQSIDVFFFDSPSPPFVPQ